MSCTDGKKYEIRHECPRTCRFPTGGHECSDVGRVDGCYCQGQLVENDQGKCVPVEQCSSGTNSGGNGGGGGATADNTAVPEDDQSADDYN